MNPIKSINNLWIPFKPTFRSSRTKTIFQNSADKIIISMATTDGSVMMELRDTESFTCLLNLSHFENRDERYFNDYACWVPLRFIQPNYINWINWWGCVLSDEKKRLAEYPIIKELCTQKNWSSFKYLNHWLIIDIINVPFKLDNCNLIPKIVYGIMSQPQKPMKFVYTRT
ncbi:MAG TPA: hypothetical protein VKR58_00405 [Aquella sp.]|nr:hypothetical protein [Aquella sp.]